MDQQDRDALGVQLTELATVYEYDLPKNKAIQYINVLLKYQPYPLEKYLTALEQYVFDKKNTKFPAPFQLFPYLDNSLSPDAMANETAARIRKAVSDIGWSQPEQARAYIGELGWAVVMRAGGWMYLCENLGVNMNTLTFYAQSRDSAKALIESGGKGVYDQPIAIPEPKQNVIQMLNLQIKQIETKKEK